MSKVVQFSEFGGPDVLQLVETNVRSPEGSEVKLKVHAVGLNRADAMIRQNQYIETPSLPSRLGYDVAAEVIEIGPDVTSVTVGDRVMTIPTFSQSEYGVYGEEAIVPENSLWPWPKNLSAAEAASVGVQYTTVYFALKHVGRVQAGDTVLVTAATGGVGFAAIEVAKEMGAKVIATTRKRDKAPALTDAGADHVVVTDEDDWGDRVNEITGGAGVKFVFDPIGGKAVPPLLETLGMGGVYAIYGLLDMNVPEVPMMPVMTKGLTLTGYTVFAFTGYPSIGIPQRAEAVAEAKEYLVSRLSDGSLKPRVSETFPLDQVADAHRSLESNKQTGKIVLAVS